MKIIQVVLFLFLINIGYAQSPWVYGAGKGYSHISIGLLSSYDQVFNGDISNLVDLEGEISEFSVQSYTEIGLGKKFGAVISLPYNMISTQLDGQPTNTGRIEGNLAGFGNAELGLKYNFLNKTTILTGQLSISMPFGSVDLESGIQTAYDATTVTAIVSAGKGFEKSYLSSYIGHDFTNNEFNDNLRFGIEYGRKFRNKLWTILAFNMKEPTFKSEKIQDPRIEETRLFVNDQFYNSLSLKLIYEINDKTGINGSTNLISVRANNLPFRAPISLGVYRKW